MSSWKRSFESVLREIEIAKKKRLTLDNLLSRKRLSQPTYDHLLKGICGNIHELESHQKSLTINMTNRILELKKQIKILEKLIACLEIKYIDEEINKEKYLKNNEIFINGLSESQIELNHIENAKMKIYS